MTPYWGRLSLWPCKIYAQSTLITNRKLVIGHGAFDQSLNKTCFKWLLLSDSVSLCVFNSACTVCLSQSVYKTAITSSRKLHCLLACHTEISRKTIIHIYANISVFSASILFDYTLLWTLLFSASIRSLLTPKYKNWTRGSLCLSQLCSIQIAMCSISSLFECYVIVTENSSVQALVFLSLLFR